MDDLRGKVSFDETIATGFRWLDGLAFWLFQGFRRLFFPPVSPIFVLLTVLKQNQKHNRRRH